MELTYIASQVLVTIAYIFIFYAMRQNDKSKMLLALVIANVLALIQFGLLGAAAGIIMTAVNILRNTIFYFNAKNNKENNKYLLISFLIVSLPINIITFASIFDIFAIVQVALITYMLWQDNVQRIRYINLVVSSCSIVYALSVNSYMIVFFEIFMIANVINMIIKHNNKKVEESLI